MLEAGKLQKVKAVAKAFVFLQCLNFFSRSQRITQGSSFLLNKNILIMEKEPFTGNMA